MKLCTLIEDPMLINFGYGALEIIPRWPTKSKMAATYHNNVSWTCKIGYLAPWSSKSNFCKYLSWYFLTENMSLAKFPLQKWYSGPFSKWPPAKTQYSVIIVNLSYFMIQTSSNIDFIESSKCVESRGNKMLLFWISQNGQIQDGRHFLFMFL